MTRHIEKLDEFHFYPRLAQARGISIVFFTKPGCGSCGAWRQVLQQLLAQREDLNVFEVDAEQNTALASEYELFHMPALFVFIDGEYHSPLQSEARLPLFIDALDRALAAPAEEAP